MTENVFKRFEIEIKKAYYAYDRYKAMSTFVLLYHEEPLTLEELASFLRVSDKFLTIDENTYFINFTFTSQENTFKASQNLLLELDRHFNKRNCYLAIEDIDTANSPRMVINKLVQILKETRKHSYSRIEDESILNSVF